MGVEVPQELKSKVAARRAFNPLIPTQAERDAAQLKQDTIDNFLNIIGEDGKIIL